MIDNWRIGLFVSLELTDIVESLPSLDGDNRF